MKHGPLNYGVILAAVVSPALADDLTIQDESHTAITTAAASNGTPGNVTITSDGLVTISASGAVVTINSNNTVDSTGGIQSTAQSNATGVHIVGGNTGSFTQHAIGVPRLVVRGEGTGNIGILVDGSAPFNGNITLEPGAIMTIYGKDSAGVAVNAPLNGNLTVDGVSGFGVGTTGVLVTSPITGAFTQTGTILPLPFLQFEDITKVDLVTGSGIAIGASIGGGFVVSGSKDAADVLSPIGAIDVRFASAPAVIIAPSVAGAGAGDIVVNPAISDTANPTYSVINRGFIESRNNNPGLPSTALLVGEHAPGLAPHATTLTGGIYNRGTIETESRSDNFFATGVSSIPTKSTAVEIGNGAIVKAFAYSQTAGSGSSTSTIVLDAGAKAADNYYNGLIVRWNGEDRVITAYNGANQTATIGALNGSSATWSSTPQAADRFDIRSAAFRNDGQILACQPQCPSLTTFPPGQIPLPGPENGSADGILIQPFGNLPSFYNAGTIAALVVSNDDRMSGLTARGINDLSGTLTEITNGAGAVIQAKAGKLAYTTNNGLLVVTPGPLLDGSQQTIAIDLSAGATGQTISNFGIVTGDVYFGSAGMNGTSAGNQLTIEGAKASVSGLVRSTGSGTLDIHISPQGTGGMLVTANSRATTMDVGAAGQVFFVLSKKSLTAPTISTTGNVTYGTGVLSAMLPTSFLANGTYTLIDAGGTLHIEDISTLDLSSDANRSSFGVPFLYKASITTDKSSTVANDGKSLKLTLTRKTVEEVGLTGDAAIMYEPLMAAALADDPVGISLVSLSSQSDVQIALNSVVPDIAGGVRALAVALTDEATGFIAARQRQLLTAPQGSRNEFRFWAQEFYNNIQEDRTASSPGFGGAGQGVALGAEWGSLNTVRYGIGLSFFSSQETERHPRDTKTDGDWGMASAYAAWRAGNFFIAPQINAASGAMQSRRAILIGNNFSSSIAKWQSYMGAGGLTSGLIFDVGQFQIIPTVAFDAMYLHETAYGEVGAGGLGLALKPQNQKSARAFAGIIGQGTFNYDEGVFLPQVIAGWSHEFLNDPITIDGAFESAPGSPFHLVGPTLEPNRIVGGMSLGYVLRNWSAGVNYDASRNSGALAQSATVSLSSRF